MSRIKALFYTRGRFGKSYRETLDRDNEYLYIAKGFGEQKTSGSSISVTNLTCEDQTIYFESKLVIPQEKENLNSISSFPYIVIKTELIDFPVVFR